MEPTTPGHLPRRINEEASGTVRDPEESTTFQQKPREGSDKPQCHALLRRGEWSEGDGEAWMGVCPLRWRTICLSAPSGKSAGNSQPLSPLQQQFHATGAETILSPWTNSQQNIFVKGPLSHLQFLCGSRFECCVIVSGAVSMQVCACFFAPPLLGPVGLQLDFVQLRVLKRQHVPEKSALSWIKFANAQRGAVLVVAKLCNEALAVRAILGGVRSSWTAAVAALNRFSVASGSQSREPAMAPHCVPLIVHGCIFAMPRLYRSPAKGGAEMELWWTCHSDYSVKSSGPWKTNGDSFNFLPDWWPSSFTYRKAFIHSPIAVPALEPSWAHSSFQTLLLSEVGFHDD